LAAWIEDGQQCDGAA